MKVRWEAVSAMAVLDCIRFANPSPADFRIRRLNGRRCGSYPRGRGCVCRPSPWRGERRRRDACSDECIRSDAGFMSVHAASLARKDVFSSGAASYEASGNANGQLSRCRNDTSATDEPVVRLYFKGNTSFL